jgi:predicted N-acyltransferase
MNQTKNTIRIIERLADIPAAQWNAVANPDGVDYDPFLSWAFLDSLETSGAVSPESGWTPYHIVIDGPDGTLKAAMPLYAKTHSQGEFVFDHSWADAYERGGGNYYPKLLTAVPFTPVTGRRRLVPNGPETAELKQSLLTAAIQLAQRNNISSFHMNFIEPSEASALNQTQMLQRTDQQFHWTNNDYKNFDDFLADLSSAKRKNLRKERRKAQDGLTFEHIRGDDITEAHWDAFYDFYLDTGQRKWGSPYLNRETFSLLSERMANDILLIFACEDGAAIGGAMNMIGSNTLYGRYWGCRETRPMLHFETCYYQAIDFAIENGLKRVEAGAQGGHKLARGYAPVATHSAHWIAHPGLRDAVSHYLKQERAAVENEIDYLQTRTPFKSTT